uniref:Uncharacterized protein n=1 Tax=Hyaloperonospora arabidopsidis (strain Emoy2) TaxID=559515 RepID=M4BL94_HYAAE
MGARRCTIQQPWYAWTRFSAYYSAGNCVVYSMRSERWNAGRSHKQLCPLNGATRKKWAFFV